MAAGDNSHDPCERERFNAQNANLTKQGSQCTTRITPGASTPVSARQGSKEHRYPERIQVRLPRGFMAAVEDHAAERGFAPHEMVRRFLLEALHANGIRLNKGA